MNIKLFEILDAATFIPAIAIRLSGNTLAEEYLLSRVGFGATQSAQDQYFLFGRLTDIGTGYGSLKIHFSEWPSNPRTMPAAHKYIAENWLSLESGDVVDVEFILGETKEPKRSERFDTDDL